MQSLPLMGLGVLALLGQCVLSQFVTGMTSTPNINDETGMTSTPNINDDYDFVAENNLTTATTLRTTTLRTTGLSTDLTTATTLRTTGLSTDLPTDLSTDLPTETTPRDELSTDLPTENETITGLPTTTDDNSTEIGDNSLCNLCDCWPLDYPTSMYCRVNRINISSIFIPKSINEMVIRNAYEVYIEPNAIIDFHNPTIKLQDIENLHIQHKSFVGKSGILNLALLNIRNFIVHEGPFSDNKVKKTGFTKICKLVIKSGHVYPGSIDDVIIEFDSTVGSMDLSGSYANIIRIKNCSVSEPLLSYFPIKEDPKKAPLLAARLTRRAPTVKPQMYRDETVFVTNNVPIRSSIMYRDETPGYSRISSIIVGVALGGSVIFFAFAILCICRIIQDHRTGINEDIESGYDDS